MFQSFGVHSEFQAAQADQEVRNAERVLASLKILKQKRAMRPLLLSEKCMIQSRIMAKMAQDEYDRCFRLNGFMRDYHWSLYESAIASSAQWKARAEKVKTGEPAHLLGEIADIRAILDGKRDLRPNQKMQDRIAPEFAEIALSEASNAFDAVFLMDDGGDRAVATCILPDEFEAAIERGLKKMEQAVERLGLIPKGAHPFDAQFDETSNQLEIRLVA